MIFGGNSFSTSSFVLLKMKGAILFFKAFTATKKFSLSSCFSASLFKLLLRL